ASKKLIIATGGMASPAQGSDGSGFKLLESLGHRIKTPLPSLSSLNSDSPFPKQLKGHRVRATISVEANGLTVAFSEGEILFTDYGLSGIAAMDVSAAVSEHFAFSKGECRAVLDLVPSLRRHELLGFLRKLIASSPLLPLEKLFFGILPGSVGRVLCKSLGYNDFDLPCSKLRDSDLIRLVETAKSFALRLTGTQRFNKAQVTRGGADIEEFDPASLKSRLVENLYACGEVLNVDGGCGGYNLQWAWSSGLLAGELN
ncbi:MAG TPA: aminoacetone oxidase family FAD-binding enzyme, partial [Clostridiales bacterium]|nr:aminoacetone oxidase family FAD-binding enzyme [Clostridiales bacterium]